LEGDDDYNTITTSVYVYLQDGCW